jgi:hypothetical protein
LLTGAPEGRATSGAFSFLIKTVVIGLIDPRGDHNGSRSFRSGCKK